MLSLLSVRMFWSALQYLTDTFVAVHNKFFSRHTKLLRYISGHTIPRLLSYRAVNVIIPVHTILVFQLL